MRILVTGGTGFIGEYFIPKLLEKGHQVKLLVRNLDKAKGLFGETCDYIVGDVTNRTSLKGSCENIDIVYHMVAKVGNELPSDESFVAFRTVNVDGTKNMIEESKKSCIQKFIFVSSIAAMGIVHENLITETSECNPYLPYQVSKYEAEELIRKEFRENSFPGIIVRPTKVYGVGEHEYSYLTLAKLCAKGLFLKLGKGKNYTSNIYVNDLVQGFVQLINSGVLGETYILTSEGSIGFQDSGKIIAKTLGRQIISVTVPVGLMVFLAEAEEKIFLAIGKKPIVTKRNIEATISDRLYDISKAKRDFGFAPEVSMEDGISRVIAWYKKERLL